MSKKTDLVQALIKEVPLRHPVPSQPMEGASLLEQGAVLVLMRHMTQAQAESSVKSLRGAYEDWNEIRVAQAQEIASHLKTSARKKGVELLNDRKGAAMALKEFLQDVFQQTHHLDLEELRDDEATAGKVAMSLVELGAASSAYLLVIAADGQVPVHPALMKLMDRLELITRTSSTKKARAAIEPLIPKGKVVEFSLAMHEILERWEDEPEPIYMSVKALQQTAYGTKTAKERESSIARAEAAAKREEERIRKEEERERKKLEVEARKRARELERKRVAEEKKLEASRAKAAAADAKRKEAAQKKADAKKAVLDAKKKAAAEKLAAQKAAAAAKAAEKAAAKKAAQKASAAKKAASKKASPKKAVSKKAASKKAATSKAPAKSSAARKSTTAGAAGKKVSSKKAASKKATSSRSVATPAAKKAASNQAAPNKGTSKKPTSKKSTTKKKVSKKPTTRRR